MTMPVRGQVHAVMDHGFKDPGSMKLRDLVEWYKKIVTAFDTLGTPTALELREVTQGWDYVVRVVATAQGVPSGWLMVAIQDLVRSELELDRIGVTNEQQA